MAEMIGVENRVQQPVMLTLRRWNGTGGPTVFEPSQEQPLPSK